LEYPIASDHRRLAYLDTSKDKEYLDKMHGVYTSLKEFYENPDDQNDIAEIWDNGEKYLGVRYNKISGSSQLVDNGEDADNYTASDDATATADDTVTYKKGNGSVKVSVTESADQATVTCAFTSISESNYKKKYFFLWVYMPSVATSIDIKFGNDASNNLSTNVTTQFSGQSFKANDWNLIAMDLNSATVNGTITATAFDYWAITINGVSTGNYYIDQSNLRAWELMDYWYYSTYNCALVSATAPNQNYFFNSSEVYSTDTKLVGDDEFIDAIMYEACLSGIDEKENQVLAQSFRQKSGEAWNALMMKYPDLEPLITSSKYNFENDPLTAI